jgi:uncharacterized damage-inducible protein DinB
MSEALITDLFRQNEWANHRLLEVCRKLTDEQLDTKAVGAYGTIRETLVHMLGAEQRYVARLDGPELEPRVHESLGFPGFDALALSATRAAEGMIERAGVMLGVTVEREINAGRFEMDTEVVFVQMLNHSTEHRSQINTILTALGIQAPGLDGWSLGQTTGRMRRL